MDTDPELVFKKAKEIFGPHIQIKESTRHDKKYMLLNPETNKWVHFGQKGYEDFTGHRNLMRREMFRRRNHKWAKAPIFSPAFLSFWLLW